MDKVTGQCPQTTTFQKRKESRGGIEPRPVRLPRLTTELNALPLGQTSSHHQSAHMAPVRKRSPPCEYANGIGTVSVRVKLFAVGPGPVLTAGAKWPTSRQKYKKEKRRKNVWWKRRRKTNKRSEKKEEAGNVSEQRDKGWIHVIRVHDTTHLAVTTILRGSRRSRDYPPHSYIVNERYNTRNKWASKEKKKNSQWQLRTGH